jgi:hypothetical protein
VLANRHLGQLPEPIKKAVLGTVRSSVLLQLDYGDAKALERRFAPLSASDWWIEVDRATEGVPTRHDQAVPLMINIL